MPGPIWVDPERTSYDALGFAHGLGSTMRAQVLRNALRARRAGFDQRSVEGAPMQQGGVLVVLPGGAIAYRYRSAAAGDHPEVEAVIDALERAVKTGGAPR